MGWQNRSQAGQPGRGASVLGVPSEAGLQEAPLPNGPLTELSPPSTGWSLLVNNIFRHLSPLGKVCPQLLYRTSGEQLAHSAGTQWLLHAIRPKWHPVGRQRGHYQRVYLGILGKGQWVRTWRRGAGTGWGGGVRQEEKGGGGVAGESKTETYQGLTSVLQLYQL